jgi:5-methylcytosine-specific restriction endonuclease McrA
MEYTTYLKSDQWRETRRRIWRRAKGRCEQCGGKGHHVHHKSYARLGAEQDSDLQLLCDFCHDRAHGLLGEMMRRVHKEMTGEVLDTSQFPFGLT